MWASPSPEAQKRIEEAEMRRRLWWPRLARTATQLIILRPIRGSRRGFADFMRQELPGYRFDARRNWWAADLTIGNYHAVVEANSNGAGGVELRISEGIRVWLGEDGDAEEQTA